MVQRSGALLPPYSKEQLVQFFSPPDLPLDALRVIVARLEPVVFEPGTRLMAQGEPGEDLFFIAEGSVEVTVIPLGVGSPFPPVRVAELMSGDVVGEMALITNQPRSATVTAIDEVTAYRLTRDNWLYLEAFHPGLAARIREVAQSRAAQAAAQ